MSTSKKLHIDKEKLAYVPKNELKTRPQFPVPFTDERSAHGLLTGDDLEEGIEGGDVSLSLRLQQGREAVLFRFLWKVWWA